jgi:hypothetical protein
MLVRMDISTKLKTQGGVASVETLRGLGASTEEVRWAVHAGGLVRIRRGWIRTPDADPAVVRAVAAGGRLCCVSAAAHYGLWVPEHGQLHVSIPHHAGRYATDGLIAHWEGEKWRVRRSPIESIGDVIRQVIICCDHETAVAVVDSALHRHKLSHDRLAQIVNALPKEYEALIADVNERSESGNESLCRVRLARMGATPQPQVEIPGIGRVDLLIGDRLIVETDGREWHDNPEAFLVDRARDLAAHRQAYLPLRLAPHHVAYEWPWVERVVASIIDRGDHLWSARQRSQRARDGFGG